MGTPRPIQSSTLIAAGATAGGTFTFSNKTSRELALILSTTTASGGNTVQVTINGVTKGGYVYPILVGTAIAAVATTVYRVGTGVTAAANLAANDLLPGTIQVVVTVVGTVAYGVDFILST